MNLKQVIELLNLINALAPAGVDLVKVFASKLQGQTDEQLKATADAIDDLIIATADAEIRRVQDAKS